MENFNGIRIESLPNLFCFRRLVLSVGQEQPCLLGLKEWPGGEEQLGKDEGLLLSGLLCSTYLRNSPPADLVGLLT